MNRGAVEQVLVDDAAIRAIAQPKRIHKVCLTEFSQITLVFCALSVSALCWATILSVI
jgi:hypothetical protein